MATAAEEQGERPARALAVDIVRDQREEIDQMREWREAWYPATGSTNPR